MPLYIIFVAIIGITVVSTTCTTAGNGFTTCSGGGTALGGLFLFWLIGAVASFFYYALQFGSASGQTVGMRVLGIAVRDADNGGSIGNGRGAGRQGIMIALGIPFGIPLLIDYLAPLWDPRRQAWHDKVVSSLVVKVK